MKNHICQNCNNEFNGEFCNQCGQKIVHRITMPHLWHDLIHAFTHADKGFFHLLIALFKKPGVVAGEYILEGKRKRYFLPLQYLIIIGTISTFIVVNTHYFENTILAMGGKPIFGNKYTPQQLAFIQQVTIIQSKYYTIMILLQLPFFALAARWIYFKKKYNYAELLTLQTFVSAQTAIIGLVIILVVVFTKTNPFIVSGIMFLFMLTFHLITYMQFFREISFKGFLKAFFSYLLGILLFMIFAMIIGMIVGMFFMNKIK